MEILGKDTSGQEIIPVAKRLELKTNRHRETDGSSWGWIDGCSKNICWSNSNRIFDYEKARALVDSYNARQAVGRSQMKAMPGQAWRLRTPTKRCRKPITSHEADMINAFGADNWDCSWTPIFQWHNKHSKQGSADGKEKP